MEYERLKSLTAQLLERNDEALRIHSIEKEYSFYEEIKPFVESVDAVLAEWKDEAVAWVRRTRPKYMHEAQVMQTYENLQNNALQCFTQVKSKRFKQTHQAIRYMLTGLLEHLQQQEDGTV